MNRSYLAHWGILGMRWGHRKGTSSKPSATKTEATPKAKPSSNDVKKHLDAASTMVNEGKKIETIVTDSRHRKVRKDINRIDLSNFSDEDLKRAVARMTMEKQYKTLQAEQLISGKNRVRSLLETTGTAINVANSAMTMLAAIEKVSGGKDKKKVT